MKHKLTIKSLSINARASSTRRKQHDDLGAIDQSFEIILPALCDVMHSEWWHRRSESLPLAKSSAEARCSFACEWSSSQNVKTQLSSRRLSWTSVDDELSPLNSKFKNCQKPCKLLLP